LINFEIAKLKLLFPRLRPYLLAVLAGFGVVGVLITLMGRNPLDAFSTIITVPLGTAHGLTETFKKFVPILLAGFAYAIPFHARLFNVGGWGQLLFGGIAVTIVGLSLSHSPPPLFLFVPLLILVGFLAGALWAVVPAVLRAYFGVHPVISTIMMNFIAVYLVNYVASTAPWAETEAAFAGHPKTLPLPTEARLPPLGIGGHAGLIVAIIVALAVYFLMKKSILGYEIKAVGANPTAAQVFGISIKRVTLLSLILGGAMAGLAGAIEVMGVHGRLIEGMEFTVGASLGIFGILSALMCACNPIGLPISAFFMSMLIVGADAMQRTMMIPVEVVFVAIVLMVLFIMMLGEKMKMR